VDQILKAYPQQVRFVYKEFPLISIHQYALSAARAAVAAQAQGKFWKMHDVLFANQRALDADSLKKYAQEVGLDVPRFEKDMTSPKTQQQIAADMQLAGRLDVRGTPTFFLNGKLVTNRSFENVKQLIDAAVQKKTGSS
jgi:protein-disulfide isomerase